ncbi:MAG: hypothetical protein KDB00_01850 [Planctomycetales bacterium]|nr:hypothetical protein [Planctomycetales bacterium]
MILALLATTLSTVACVPLVAQEPENSSSDENDDTALQQRLAGLAAEFQFTALPDDQPPILISETPLLSYTNPIRAQGQVGSIFLWTRDKRPAVIGSLWTFRINDDSRRLSIELHSLSQNEIQAKLPTLENPRRPLPDFRPPAPAITWAPLSSAGLRSASPAQVRSKIRRNAERFSAEVIDPQTGNAQALRLLPKPLYEFKTDDVVYGAICAFVLATDPELIVILEARKSGNSIELHYAFARMTGRQLKVKIEGEDTLSFDRAPVWDGNHAYYFCPNVTSLVDANK